MDREFNSEPQLRNVKNEGLHGPAEDFPNNQVGVRIECFGKGKSRRGESGEEEKKKVEMCCIIAGYAEQEVHESES